MPVQNGGTEFFMYGNYYMMDYSSMAEYFVYIIIPLIISIWASMKVKITFSKYSQIANRKGYTAAQVAERILQSAGVYNVRIERVPGDLTDHFDPRDNVLRLSDSVYSSNSVAALGVAAHEAGHAIQHAQGYMPIRIRSAIVPVVNISSRLAVPMFILGLVLGMTGLAWLGVILFAGVVLFSIVTLPVEFNASSRALKNLIAYNILSPEENDMARKVLGAAAMTYVASALASLGQLLYWISRFKDRD